MDDDVNSNKAKELRKSDPSSADDWDPVDTRTGYYFRKEKDKTQNK